MLLALAAAAWGCGGGEPERPPAPAKPTPPPDTRVVEGDGELAVGITEPNPNFVWPASERDVAEGFARWRDELARMRPAYYRLVVDWPSVASEDGRKIDLDKPVAGCMRDVPPCGHYAGVRDQLRALAAAQRASEGNAWRALVVITGTPSRLAREPSGCERARTQDRSRAPRRDALEHYERLILAVGEAAREAGAELRFWSPWNEANHPFGLSPQRTRCSEKAPSAAVEPYAELARAMQSALERLPGDQDLVLGELAGLRQRKPGYTRISEFIRELPRDLVCSVGTFSQHGYVGGPDPVEDVARALRRHGCERAHEIWVTETGAGAPRRGEERKLSSAAQRRACRLIRRRLRQWYEDPRVTAAFQYTLREDDRFPTGLVTTDLDEAYPALREWQAWGARRDPREPPPPSTCGERT